MIAPLPEPLVTTEVDLKDFKYVPLYMGELRRSKAWSMARRQPEVGFYMINLWGESWFEVPAGSLPDDDDLLADLAVCPPNRWPEVREKVLHGWVKCSDGRLYHPFVCEKAQSAWEAKQKQRLRTQAAREAKAAKRKENTKTRRTTPGTGKPAERVAPAEQLSLTPPSSDALQEAFDAYNALARKIGLPKAQNFSDDRKRKLRQRLKDCGGLQGWTAALEMLEASRHCRGDNDRGWLADLDFLLQSKSFTRLMEGFYTGRGGKGGRRQEQQDLMATFEGEG